METVLLAILKKLYSVREKVLKKSGFWSSLPVFKCSISSTVSGWFFFVLYWGNPFSVQLVKLINFFKRARWLKNRLRDNVESPRFKRSVPTQTAYRLRLKRLIPVGHDLSYVVYISSLWRPGLFACLLQQFSVLFYFAVRWVFALGSGSADAVCNKVVMDLRLSRRCRTFQRATLKWFWPAVTASTAEHLE